MMDIVNFAHASSYMIGAVSGVYDIRGIAGFWVGCSSPRLIRGGDRHGGGASSPFAASTTISALPSKLLLTFGLPSSATKR